MGMKIRVKINCADNEKSQYIDMLDGFNPNSIHKGVIFDPKLIENSPEKRIYQLPDDFESFKRKSTILIDITENGGYSEENNIKDATIVAGYSGKPLKPYFIPKHPTKCGDHAFFSIPEKCFSIRAFVEKVNEKNENDDFVVEIYEHQVDESGIEKDNTCAINTKKYFTGDCHHIPYRLIRLFQPALVAIDKANCKNCTHVHFYVDSTIYRKVYDK